MRKLVLEIYYIVNHLMVNGISRRHSFFLTWSKLLFKKNKSAACASCSLT